MKKFLVVGDSHAPMAARAVSVYADEIGAQWNEIAPIQVVGNFYDVINGKSSTVELLGGRSSDFDFGDIINNDTTLIVAGTFLSGHIISFPTTSKFWRKEDTDRKIRLPYFCYDSRIKNEKIEILSDLLVTNHCFHKIYITQFLNRTEKIRKSELFKKVSKVIWFSAPPPQESILGFVDEKFKTVMGSYFSSGAYYYGHYTLWRDVERLVLTKERPNISVVFARDVQIKNGFLQSKYNVRHDDPIHANESYYSELIRENMI